jgi:hypothetical protein
VSPIGSSFDALGNLSNTWAPLPGRLLPPQGTGTRKFCQQLNVIPAQIMDKTSEAGKAGHPEMALEESSANIARQNRRCPRYLRYSPGFSIGRQPRFANPRRRQPLDTTESDTADYQ